MPAGGWHRSITRAAPVDDLGLVAAVETPHERSCEADFRRRPVNRLAEP